MLWARRRWGDAVGLTVGVGGGVTDPDVLASLDSVVNYWSFRVHVARTTQLLWVYARNSECGAAPSSVLSARSYWQARPNRHTRRLA